MKNSIRTAKKINSTPKTNVITLVQPKSKPAIPSQEMLAVCRAAQPIYELSSLLDKIDLSRAKLDMLIATSETGQPEHDEEIRSAMQEYADLVCLLFDECHTDGSEAAQ